MKEEVKVYMSIIDGIKRKISSQEDNLQGKTVQAAFWSLLGAGGRGTIRFISNLILTRLLFPEAFGLMATAMIVLTLVQVFSDTGVKTALIQNPRGGERRYIDAAFIIAMGRSIILYGVVLVAIQPMANFYGEPALEGLLTIMSIALLAEGLINPALPLLVKKLRLEKQVIYAIGSQFAGFVTTVTLVYFMRSVEALAIGYLSTSIFRVIGSYLVTPYKPSLSWDKQAGAELFHFGKYIIVNTLIGWALLNIDRLMIGKMLDMEQLAFYNIALYIGTYVSEVLVQVFAQSYFPAVSSIADDHIRVQAVYKKTVSTIVGLVAPFLMLLVLFSQELVDILYDPRYALAGGILLWISFKSFFHVIPHLQSGTLMALGKPSYVTLTNGISLVLVAVLLPVMITRYGLSGAGIAMLLSTFVVGIIQSTLMVKVLKFQFWVIVSPWLHLLGTATFMTAIYLVISNFDAVNTSHFLFKMVPMVFLAGATALMNHYSKLSLRVAKTVIGALK